MNNLLNENQKPVTQKNSPSNSSDTGFDWTLSHDCTSIQVNPNWLAQQDQTMCRTGLLLAEFIFPQDLAAVRQALEMLIRGEKDSFHLKHRISIPNNSARWFSSHGVLVRNPSDPAGLSIAGISRLVDARESDQQPSDETHCHESLLNIIDDAIVGLDDHNRVVYVNNRALTILDLPNGRFEDGLYLKQVLQLQSLSNDSDSATFLEPAIQGAVANSKFIVLRPDGTRQVSECHVKPLVANNETPIVRVLTVRDMTGLRDIESSESTSQQSSDESTTNNNGNQFDSIAHRFNNLLAAILSSAEVLSYSLKDSISSEDSMFLEYIQKRCLEAGELFSQHSQSACKKRRHRLDAIDLINTIVTSFATTLASDITLEQKLPRGPTWIEADKAALGPAINSVLENSAQALPNGGQITVTINCSEVNDKLSANDHPAGANLLLQIEYDGTVSPATTGETVQDTAPELSKIQSTIAEHQGTILFSSTGASGGIYEIQIPITGPASSNDARPDTGPADLVL